MKLVSMQVENGRDQLATCEFPLTDLLGPRKRDFVETASLLTQLDLLIAPDSAVCHLGGGLGVPVWVGVCAPGDWRYPHGRNDTPWYPTMRLFRQTKLNDWEPVFREMASTLEQMLATRANAA